MDYLAIAVSIISAALAVPSAFLAWDSWRKARSRIMMLSEIGRATQIVPAWYTERMMSDYWGFGLLSTDGTVIAIHRITAISDDGKWMDVQLMDYESARRCIPEERQIIAAVQDGREDASVRIDSISTAYDIWAS